MSGNQATLLFLTFCLALPQRYSKTARQCCEQYAHFTSTAGGSVPFLIAEPMLTRRLLTSESSNQAVWRPAVVFY